MAMAFKSSAQAQKQDTRAETTSAARASREWGEFQERERAGARPTWDEDGEIQAETH